VPKKILSQEEYATFYVNGANQELLQMYKEDKSDRAGIMTLTPEQAELHYNKTNIASKDAIRQQRVRDMLTAGLIKVPADYYHAWLIMQHGKTLSDITLAYQFAKKLYFEYGNEYAAQNYALSKDRCRKFKQKPQKYGTQLEKSPDGNSYVFWKFDAPVEEVEARRKALGLETLAEYETLFLHAK